MPERFNHGLLYRVTHRVSIYSLSGPPLLTLKCHYLCRILYRQQRRNPLAKQLPRCLHLFLVVVPLIDSIDPVSMPSMDTSDIIVFHRE